MGLALNDEFCAKDALLRANIEESLSQQPHELVVLQFEFAQSLDFRSIHAAARGVPLVKAGVAKTVLAPDLLIGIPTSACLKKPMICSLLHLLNLHVHYFP